MQNPGPDFTMYSASHIVVLVLFMLMVIVMFFTKDNWMLNEEIRKRYERIFALSLLVMELGYHLLYIKAGRWELSYSLPLELCSFTLFASILLLWNGNKYLIDFVFYAGIAGALQALLTPVIDFGFPHFRYFHFFYTHIGIILTAFYFRWVRGYYPTFKGLIHTMILLNLLLPIVFVVNYFTDGNYMFLVRKPSSGSILDFLGPYPWYIGSLEGVAFIMFFVLWILFRERKVS